MMTTWVALHSLPLSPGQKGPCEIVNASDAAIYAYDVESGQSTVKIVAGMTLCESVLLRGMLVHSAGDYAELLVQLTGMHKPTFVAAMNQYAHALGLRHTHYVDVTGISTGDVSTALTRPPWRVTSCPPNRSCGESSNSHERRSRSLASFSPLRRSSAKVVSWA